MSVHILLTCSVIKSFVILIMLSEANCLIQDKNNSMYELYITHSLILPIFANGSVLI